MEQQQQQQQYSQMLDETNMASEKIQKCLEENQELIMFILESQRLGRHRECDMHKAKLQWNLTYLTNLADIMSQPPPPSQLPQPAPSSLILSAAAAPSKQLGHWLHHHEGTPSAGEPPFARQSQIQLRGDDDRRYHQQELPYYLGRQQQQQQNISEPKMVFEQSTNTPAFQFVGGSESGRSNNHQMFDVMGNNQDGFLSYGNFQGI